MVIILILVMVTFSLSTHNSITISITYVEPLLDIITIRVAVDHAQHNRTN